MTKCYYYESSDTMNLFKNLKNRFKPRYVVNNDTAERIASLKISVPALHVGVLTYTPEELKINDPSLEGKTIKLYYPPEEVSNKNFLKNLELAPFIVGVGHSATTSEKNKKIDGWASTVHYDETKKAAILDGVVKGKNEVDYIQENLGTNGFGASAFIDFIAEVKSGVTPDGQDYNAVARDLKATHIALTGSVRDPKNKIQVRNTVVVSNAVVVNDGQNNSEVNMELTADQIAAIVENAVSKAVTAKNSEDRLDKLEKMIASLTNAVEDMKEEKKDEEKKEEKKADSENADEEKKEENKDEEEKEGETVKNARPSQELIKAFSTALNIDFGAKTPSFSTLASLSGITEKDPFAMITAVNAKFAELMKAGGTAANAATGTLTSKEVF